MQKNSGMISNVENLEIRCAPEWVQPNECICCSFELSDYLKSKNSCICCNCSNTILRENKPKLLFIEENAPINFSLLYTERSNANQERANSYAKYFNTINL